MSNLINREDAIANVALEIWHYPSGLYTSLDRFENCRELAELALNRLPSAESERIIRCANCRFFKRNIPCVDGHYNGCEMWLDDGDEIRVLADDYCSKALPKER